MAVTLGRSVEYESPIDELAGVNQQVPGYIGATLLQSYRNPTRYTRRCVMRHGGPRRMESRWRKLADTLLFQGSAYRPGPEAGWTPDATIPDGTELVPEDTQRI